MEPGGRTRFALVVLATASLLASWNQVSAPAGLIVGLAVVLICLAERRRHGGLSRATAAALAVSVAGVLVSTLVLALAAGVGPATGGPAIVDEVPAKTREEQLRRAAERTKPARDAARRELERLEPGR